MAKIKQSILCFLGVLCFIVFMSSVKAISHGNLDPSSNGNELAIVTEYGDLQVFSEDGALINAIQSNERVFEKIPYIADVNNDGTFEIVVLSRTESDQWYLNVLSSSGADIYTPQNITGEVFDYTIGNIDGDNNMEIVLTTMESKILIYDVDQSSIGLTINQQIGDISFVSTIQFNGEQNIICAEINYGNSHLYKKDSNNLIFNTTWQSNGSGAVSGILQDQTSYYHLSQTQINKFNESGVSESGSWPINLSSQPKNFSLVNVDDDAEYELMVNLTNFQTEVYNSDGTKVESGLLNQKSDTTVTEQLTPTTFFSQKLNSVLSYFTNQSGGLNTLQVFGDFYHRKANVIQNVNISGGPNHAYTLPIHAFDGDYLTFWQGSYQVDSWQLFYDFDEITYIDKIRVAYYNSNFVPASAVIEFSNDAVNWFGATEVERTVSEAILNLNARYVRIQMDGKSTSKNYTPAIREVQFLNSTYYSPACITYGALPEYAFDDNPQTFWQGPYEDDSWMFQRDLGSVQAIKQIEITYYNKSFIPQNAQIDLSNDGQTWTESYNVPAGEFTEVFINSSARFLRYSASGKSLSRSYTPAIRELKIISDDTICGGPTITDGALPEYAFDGDFETFWQGSYEADEWYLIRDFGSEQQFENIKITYYNENFIPLENIVEFSNDGISWSNGTEFSPATRTMVFVNTRARYTRFNMSGKNASTGYTSAIREIELLNGSGENITGGPNHAYTAPLDVLDNSLETFWQGSYDQETWELLYDLGSIQNVSSILIDYFNCNFVPASMEIEVSTDGENFQNAGSGTNEDPLFVEFAGQEARYIKFVLSGLDPDTNYTPAIREIDINEEEPATVENCSL